VINIPINLKGVFCWCLSPSYWADNTFFSEARQSFAGLPGKRIFLL
ncbi:MAG: hypothetical protein ACI965_002038, partial [Paraglaciecola sp.]